MKEDASPPRPQPSRHIRDRAVMACYLALVAVATLTPGTASSRLPLWCVTCTDLWLLDLLQNVVLFVPFGWLARRLGMGAAGTVLLGSVLSLTIEGAQWAVPALERDPILGDWLANTGGAWLGWASPGEWARWQRSMPRARRIGILLAWTSVVMGGGVLLTQPSFPTDADWYGQAAAEFGHLDRWRGPVRGGRVNTQTVPFQLPATRFVASGEAAHRLTLSAEISPAAATRRLAPIISVYDGRQREVAVLGMAGEALLLRVRTRAGAMGLRSPIVRMALPPASRNAGSQAAPANAVAALGAESEGGAGALGRSIVDEAASVPSRPYRRLAAAIEGRRWCLAVDQVSRCASVSLVSLLAAQLPWHDSGEVTSALLGAALAWLAVGVALVLPTWALRRR